MFSMCSELTPRARIPDTRIPQLMQPCLHMQSMQFLKQAIWLPSVAHVEETQRGTKCVKKYGSSCCIVFKTLLPCDNYISFLHNCTEFLLLREC